MSILIEDKTVSGTGSFLASSFAYYYYIRGDTHMTSTLRGVTRHHAEPNIKLNLGGLFRGWFWGEGDNITPPV